MLRHHLASAFVPAPSVVFKAPFFFLEIENVLKDGQRQVEIISRGFDPLHGIQVQTHYLMDRERLVVAGIDYTLRLARSGTFMGSASRDLIVGTQGNNRIFSSAGDDYVKGFTGHDSLWGGLGHDTLVGGAGHDVLDGETGEDWLFGDLGNDTLRSWSGADQLFGGDGHDVFLIGFSAADRSAQGITALQAGQGHDLYQFDFSQGLATSGRHFTLEDREGHNTIQFVNLDRSRLTIEMTKGADRHAASIMIAEKGNAPLFSLTIKSGSNVSFDLTI